MNKENLVTVIATLITYIAVCIAALTGKDLQLDPDTTTAVATLIAAGIMYYVNHYYNHDYSGIARKMTPLMRKLKKLEAAGDLELLDKIQNLVDEWEKNNGND